MILLSSAIYVALGMLRVLSYCFSGLYYLYVFHSIRYIGELLYFNDMSSTYPFVNIFFCKFVLLSLYKVNNMLHTSVGSSGLVVLVKRVYVCICCRHLGV